MLYLHPLLASLTCGLLAYAAVLGLRSRPARRGGAGLLRRHARLAPYTLWLVAGNWILGSASVWWGRDDVELASTGHFKVGCYLLAVLAAAALLSRWMDHVPYGRTLHPMLGAAAVLLAGFQVFLGLQIMPK
jgi:hypothetical protein